MKIAQIGVDGMAVAGLEGAQQDVDLSLIGPVKPGDYVIVHAGYAIERLDEAEAMIRIDLFKELVAGWKEGT
jgi:hydrogenase expression/formation protein HypC